MKEPKIDMIYMLHKLFYFFPRNEKKNLRDQKTFYYRSNINIQGFDFVLTFHNISQIVNKKNEGTQGRTEYVKDITAKKQKKDKAYLMI